jgi:phosphoserine phosphatase
MDANRRTLLITLTGNDRPGVTKRLFSSLEPFGVNVLDIEQLVVRGRLILAVLLEVTGADTAMAAVRTEMRRAAADLDMDIETVPGAAEDDERRRNRIHVTVLGAPLTPGSVAHIATEIADRGGNIDRIRRIASYPVTAIVLEGSGVSVADLRRPLAAIAADQGVDLAVQEAGLDRRGQYLLADEAGVLTQVAAITDAAMHGELDFEQALRARVALLRGLEESAVDRVRERITLTPGARTLCRTLNRLGYRVALVSGGFTSVIAPIAAELGVTDVRANTLEVVDGFLTGEVIGPVVDRIGKRTALEDFALLYEIPTRRTIAIGDGANDVDMLEASGLGIAFNGKAAARDAADTALNVPYLDSVLFLLGITREEIESADARD